MHSCYYISSGIACLLMMSIRQQTKIEKKLDAVLVKQLSIASSSMMAWDDVLPSPLSSLSEYEDFQRTLGDDETKNKLVNT